MNKIFGDSLCKISGAYKLSISLMSNFFLYVFQSNGWFHMLNTIFMITIFMTFWKRTQFQHAKFWIHKNLIRFQFVWYISANIMQVLLFVHIWPKFDTYFEVFVLHNFCKMSGGHWLYRSFWFPTCYVILVIT